MALVTQSFHPENRGLHQGSSTLALGPLEPDDTFGGKRARSGQGELPCAL